MSHETKGYGQNQQYYTQQPYNTREELSPIRHRNGEKTERFTVNELSGEEHLHPMTGFGNGDFPNAPSNPLSEFLADFLTAVVELSIKVSHQLYTNSSVIVIAAGLAGGVHHFASQQTPLANAALDASFHGSVAVAKYVGLSFFIKTALTPIHESFAASEKNIIHSNENERFNPAVIKRKNLINSHVVSYLTPMALAWIFAYTQGIPVKLGFATLYTIGTFGVMKVLGKGYDYALDKYEKRQREQ